MNQYYDTLNEEIKEYFEQFIGEFMITFVKTGTDLYYGKFITFAAKRINPYVFLAVVSNGIITCLANTNEVNKGDLTLPCIVDAMNSTVSKIAYTYALFMMNPTNTLYYELEALFAAYKFQVELGAEVHMNLCLADYNSYLKRFIRFINPFDKDDKMRLDKANLVAYAHGEYFELGKRIGKFGFSTNKKKKKKPNGKQKS